MAGDVTLLEAKAAVSRSFGALAGAGFDKKRGPAEPAQTAFRYGRSTGDLKQGYSVFGWHTQGVGGDAELALDLVTQILGSGRSSRLFRHVVGPDAAATAVAFHYQFDDVGSLIVQASFDEAKRAEVDRRVLAEVERLKAHGPTPFELAGGEKRAARADHSRPRGRPRPGAGSGSGGGALRRRRLPLARHAAPGAGPGFGGGGARRGAALLEPSGADALPLRAEPERRK